jgi:hypothetical protein
MKKIKETSTNLTIKVFPLTGLFIGIFLIGFVILLISLFFSVTYLDCNRQTQICALKTEGIQNSYMQSFALADLQGARIDQSDTSGHIGMYGIILLTQQGNFLLANSYSSGYQNKLQVVNEINHFVEQKLNILHIKYKNISFTLLTIMSFLVILGLYLILVGSKIILVVIDKAKNIILLESRSLVKKNKYAWVLTDIKAITTACSGAENTNNYACVLITTAGEIVPLIDKSSFFEVKSIADTINKFLISGKI